MEHRVGSGWDSVRSKHVLIETARKWVAVYNNHKPQGAPLATERQIPIRVDDANLGGGVVDNLKAEGYRVMGVNSGTMAKDIMKYPLMRDQLWFSVAEMAKKGELDFSRLPKKSLVDLKKQAMGVRWIPASKGRRQIVPKDETRKVIGRSPDGMDALNIAFLNDGAGGGTPFVFSQSRWSGPGRG